MRRVRGLNKVKIKRFTFMIIPDANQSVVRFRLNSLILYFAASVLLAIVAMSCIIYSINQQNVKLKNQLALELSSKTVKYETDLSGKQRTIEKLQDNVIQLSQQTDDMKSKLNELKQLEDDIKSITKIDDKSKPVSIASAADESGDLASSYGEGGPAWPVNESDIDGLAVETQDSLDSMDQDLSKLMSSLSDAKQKIVAYNNFLRITPSMWPTNSRRITSPYGYRKDPFTGRLSYHDGVDIGAPIGDPVYVTADGVVDVAGYDSSRGNHIIVRHANGLETEYMHLSKMLVSEGDKVSKGETIGKVGTTGRSTGPHLHYTVIKNGNIIDPMPYTKPPGKE